MSLSAPFYHGLLRKYVTMFGYIFDDIRIERVDKTGDIDLIKVPITYGPKDKMIARVIQDPTISRQAAIQLPMMSFLMTGFQYDPNRKTPTMNRQSVVNGSNSGNKYYQYSAVPYNIGFALYVYVKNAEDGNKIIEQILPFFTPDWTLTADLVPEMNIRADVPLVLLSVNMEDSYDGDFKERRALIWTLEFTMKGYFYGPTANSSIIKFIDVNVRSASSDNLINAVGNTGVSAAINIQPGLLANGQPTSNAAASIPVSQIFSNNNYGYVVSINDQG